MSETSLHGELSTKTHSTAPHLSLALITNREAIEFKKPLVIPTMTLMHPEAPHSQETLYLGTIQCRPPRPKQPSEPVASIRTPAAPVGAEARENRRRVYRA